MIWDKWRLKGLSSLENLFSDTLLGNSVLKRRGPLFRMDSSYSKTCPILHYTSAHLDQRVFCVMLHFPSGGAAGNVNTYS